MAASESTDQLDPLAKTALWTASMRAREHEREDRLFCDPLASSLAGTEGPEIMHRFEGAVQPGVEDPALAVRTRYLDDQLVAQDRDGMRQFVFLAVGMDTRAFRLPWSTGVTVFELDRPTLLTLKDEILDRAGARSQCERIPLGVDLVADWSTPLLEAGFDPARPTTWLIEGLLYFLDPLERDLLLQKLTEISASGSRLLADYVGQTVLDSSAMSSWRTRMEEQGHPWKSGTDEPQSLFSEFGWSVCIAAYGDPEADYGRWGDAVVAPGVPGTRGRYLITAELP
ncbi:SAM-dependent methyltransferase [Streptomyces sp. NPDC091204]|uniref:SAM-dependent methyltransferase n=1 Tax=Streptomyces sp. NPDC091204 TaxID=3155299 RepID=UPI0034185919